MQPRFRSLGVLALVVSLLDVSLLGGAGLPAADAAQEYDEVRDVVYAEHDNHQLKADVFMPKGKGPFPAVLVVHGGAWITGSKSNMNGVARHLAKNGFTAVSINYRLAPRWVFPAQIEDCKAAVRWMRENAERYKIDPERIGGYGYSAGGQLVCLLGTTSAEDGLDGANATDVDTRLQAVVAGGAPCEFRILPKDNRLLAYWLGGSRAEKPEAYELASPLRFVSKDDPPVFFFHGETDVLVPIASSQAMVAALVSVGVEASLYTVPKSNHIMAFFDNVSVDKATQFLKQHLKKTTTKRAKSAKATAVQPGEGSENN